MINDIDFEKGDHVEIFIRESLMEDEGYRDRKGNAKAFIMKSEDILGNPFQLKCFEILQGDGLVPNGLVITANQINNPILHLREGNESIAFLAIDPRSKPSDSIHMISLSMDDLNYNWNKHLAYIENQYKLLSEWYGKKHKVDLSEKEVEE